jgi:hypothetical protein
VVDGTGLENRHTRKGIGGSNPSLSARFSTLLFPTTGAAELTSLCLHKSIPPRSKKECPTPGATWFAAPKAKLT